MSAVGRMRMSSLCLCDSAGKQTIEDFLDVGGGKVIPLTHSVTHSAVTLGWYLSPNCDHSKVVGAWTMQCNGG